MSAMTHTSWFKLSSLFSTKRKLPPMQDEPVSNEKAMLTTLAPLMSKITTHNGASLPSPIATIASTATSVSTPPTPTDSLETDHVLRAKSDDNDASIHSKDSVPLGPCLRYRMTRSDRRSFQRRRITRPFAPKYEIEWQENQWLQLDESTNKQIEQMRRNGFTKIAIRRDASLEKHIEYNRPTELDVQLELSFNNSYPPESGNQSKLVDSSSSCCQPSQFSVRRTHWWRTSHRVAEAYLPDWVDSDLCCNVPDAPDNYSAGRSSLSYSLNNMQHPKMPDTPIISQKSSFSQLPQQQQQEQDYSYKPLQYNNPPFLMEKPTLVLG
ncbi:hypothetical protein [Parasitella parasitica]|uniref:Uncharacterized protein n=1 Tax=Parasitella parasitica TaxID=35722 RepID=A0A0B7MVU9_9FUNG|nr:hypothetical protein [Parasitella parasitica]